MGTRGFVGFIIDGEEKIAYTHFDSYPSGVGADVYSWIRRHLHALTCDMHRGTTDQPVILAHRLQLVAEDGIPTPEAVAHLTSLGTANLDVDRIDPVTNAPRQVPSWYQLLRDTQGDLDAILSSGYMLDGSGFPCDSLFAEWGYIVDLDNQVFEVYRGFQKHPHTKGRFADRSDPVANHGYYACALTASWPLSELPQSVEEFEAAVDPRDDEDV